MQGTRGSAIHPTWPVRLGSMPVAIGREAGLTAADADPFARLRDRTPAEPLEFE
ncbi:MAG: hypothetical protein INR65_17430 [Gluconacetobacter diazotrophicus]|nr:hypothetical protein [Gluconacetobacter diazotrophicus]